MNATLAMTPFAGAALWTLLLLRSGLSLPLLWTDSPSYYEFAPFRTPAYPVFLWLTGWIGGGLAIAAIQLGAFVAASIVFAGELRRFLGVAWPALLFQILFWFNPVYAVSGEKFFDLPFRVAPEALATPTLLAFAAMVLRYGRLPGAFNAIALGVLAGFLISLRPVFLVLIPALPIIFFLPHTGRSHNTLRSILWHTFLALAAIVPFHLASCGVQAKVNGFFGTQTFLGRELLGKMSLLAATNPETKDDVGLLSHLAGRVTPIKPVWDRLNPFEKARLAHQYAVSVRWSGEVDALIFARKPELARLPA